MERIEIIGFGELGRFDAAHIVDLDGRVLAYVPEPQARTERASLTQDWSQEREDAFVAAILDATEDYKGYCVVQLDPDRDTARELIDA